MFSDASSKERRVVFDTACGSGIVTDIILRKLVGEGTQGSDPNIKIVAGDFSPAMVAATEERIKKNGWTDYASTQLADMQDLNSLNDDHFSHVITNCGVMFPPEKEAMLRGETRSHIAWAFADDQPSEIKRVLQPGGMNAFTTWSEGIGWIKLVQDACATIPGAPPYPSPDEAFSKVTSGRWQDKSFIREQLEKAGFEEIETNDSISTSRLSEEACVNLFAGGMVRGISSSFWTAEQLDFVMPKLPDAVRGLFKARGITHFEFQMHALVTTCRKPSSA